ncbi:MAG: hypothetical protein IJ489_03330 [Clostridia bacterium]|nr:hypothetical protein [Clostridia bacterium]
MMLCDSVPSSTTNFSALAIMLPIILFVLAFLIGLGFAQYHVSKSKNKALGLILPIVFCVLGLSVTIFISFVLSLAAFAGRTFLIFFIPTQLPALAYIIIYFSVRSSQPKDDNKKRDKEIEKMNIQDL